MYDDEQDENKNPNIPEEAAQEVADLGQKISENGASMESEGQDQQGGKWKTSHVSQSNSQGKGGRG